MFSEIETRINKFLKQIISYLLPQTGNDLLDIYHDCKIRRSEMAASRHLLSFGIISLVSTGVARHGSGTISWWFIFVGSCD